jgi:hypothetical protein
LWSYPNGRIRINAANAYGISHPTIAAVSSLFYVFPEYASRCCQGNECLAPACDSCVDNASIDLTKPVCIDGVWRSSVESILDVSIRIPIPVIHTTVNADLHLISGSLIFNDSSINGTLKAGGNTSVSLDSDSPLKVHGCIDFADTVVRVVVRANASQLGDHILDVLHYDCKVETLSTMEIVSEGGCVCNVKSEYQDSHLMVAYSIWDDCVKCPSASGSSTGTSPSKTMSFPLLFLTSALHLKLAESR